MARVFQLENGPFNDGPETLYVRAAERAEANEFGQLVDDFTPASITKIDAAPEGEEVYDYDGENVVLPEGDI